MEAIEADVEATSGDRPDGPTRSFPKVRSFFGTVQHPPNVSHIGSRDQHVGPPKSWNLRAILFGQAIALLAASVNASSFTLEYHLNVFLPLFNMMIMYVLLAFHLLYNRQERQQQTENFLDCTYTLPFTQLRLRMPVYVYLAISLLDVGSNYQTLLSFRYTSLTSTTLLGSLTIPSTMLCCRLLLQATYRTAHYVGVCLCLLGGTMTVWSDLGPSSDTSSLRATSSQPQHSYIGDALAMSAALLYGLSDAVAEYQCKNVDRVEYLGMIGVFGSILCLGLFMLLEWNELLGLLYHTVGAVQLQAVLTTVWYISSLWLYYVTASYFLTRSDATLLNLSLQTSSLWAILFSVAVSHIAPSRMFYVALGLVSTGVFVYEIFGTKRVFESGESEVDKAEGTDLLGLHHRDYESTLVTSTTIP